MLMHFGWACEMPPLTDDLDNDDDKPRYLVPWFLECKCPSTVERNWPYWPDKSQVEYCTMIFLSRHIYMNNYYSKYISTTDTYICISYNKGFIQIQKNLCLKQRCK